jgi:hypothetical protein
MNNPEFEGRGRTARRTAMRGRTGRIASAPAISRRLSFTMASGANVRMIASVSNALTARMCSAMTAGMGSLMMGFL